MSDHQPEPSESARTRLSRQESTRADALLPVVEYHGSSAARHSSQLRKRRPRACANRSRLSLLSCESLAAGARFETSMSSTMHADSSAASPFCTRCASIAASCIATTPPIECPTTTYGARTPCASAAAMTSLASASVLKSSGAPSGLSPCPRRSNASAGRPCFAISARIPFHVSLDESSPWMKIVVGQCGECIVLASSTVLATARSGGPC
mmetsp:Transcript_38453/g.84496  ORF Transcript_38453/g.84496 Transcript_38453/m.84496 type:complete len:210 (-) Transcript_38453:234-863(-)